MPSSELAVSQDGNGASLQSNQKFLQLHNCHYCKKNKSIHNHFHHITDTSIPTSFTRYTTNFINSNIVVVDGLNNLEDDLDEFLGKLPLPWISLNVRNGYLFVPTIQYVNPSLGLKYITNDGVTECALLPRNKIILSTVIRNWDRFLTTRPLMHLMTWNVLNTRVFKLDIPIMLWKWTQVLHCWYSTKQSQHWCVGTNLLFFEYDYWLPRHHH